MTWNHPRGYDPMVACSRIWHERTGVAIEWDKRSLQDFESFPVEEPARNYDLIVIDHPHVGQITEENCLAPLDIAGKEAAFRAIAKGSVGQSFESYNWRGRQWGFPIDAATQVQAFRPDLITAPPADWNGVLALARTGAVMMPMRPPHSLMTFYSLCGNLGRPCSTIGTELIDSETGARALTLLGELVALMDPACFEKDPIAVLEAMATAGSAIACAPLIYGYVSYSADGFRDHRIAFADIPSAGAEGPVGTALGGTGIAVSARSANITEAIDFAYWLAGAEAQAGPYVAAGGQAGHTAAWQDPAVNAPVADFYLNTRRTLEGAWVRPRHNGYMPFQGSASERVNEALRRNEAPDQVISDLNTLFRDSFS
ncbi:MAG TPA: extracellular solute-binding protein [Pararhizobium sp.]|nr:extracellular solute-binding protein [Pararhizobium sp.]